MPELLNLDTLIERPRIAIDGVAYDILSPDELPLLTSQRVAALGRRLDTLLKADEVNEGMERELSAVLGKIAAIVMEPVPVEVRSKLKEAQQLAVIEVFTMLSLARKAKLAGATIAQAMPTTTGGAAPSPGSSTSTAATPSAG